MVRTFVYDSRMGHGQATRDAILEHAIGLARRVGLEGLTIGRLAADLDLSKSGLFAHFGPRTPCRSRCSTRLPRFVEPWFGRRFEAPRRRGRDRALFERWLTGRAGRKNRAAASSSGSSSSTIGTARRAIAVSCNAMARRDRDHRARCGP